MKTMDQGAYDGIRRQYMAAFKENGINSDRLLEYGLRSARRQQTNFLPSPGVFIGWCRDEQLRASGLPSQHEAYLLWARTASYPADTRDWTAVHPSIYYAHTKLIGEYYNLTRQNDYEQRKRFDVAWKQVIADAIAGTDFSAMLPPPPDNPSGVIHKYTSKEDGLKKLQEIAATLKPRNTDE